MNNKKRILIVDNDIMTLRMIKKYLEGKYDIFMENSGQRLMEKPEDYDVDMIILDIDMPNISGIQIYEEYIKNPMHKDIPFVFLTASQDEEGINTTGASGIITKTLTKMDYLKRVELIFNQHGSSYIKRNVLVVDSDISFLKDFERNTDKAKYSLVFARRCSDALEILKYKKVGCIVLGNDEMGMDRTLMREKMSVFLDDKEGIFVMPEGNRNITEIILKVGEKFDNQG